MVELRRAKAQTGFCGCGNDCFFNFSDRIGLNVAAPYSCCMAAIGPVQSLLHTPTGSDWDFAWLGVTISLSGVTHDLTAEDGCCTSTDRVNTNVR